MLRRPVEPAAKSGHFNSARECSLSGNSGHVHEGHVCLASASDFQKPKIDETIMSLFRFRDRANEGRLALPLHGDGHGVVDMKTALPVTFIALRNHLCELSNCARCTSNPLWNVGKDARHTRGRWVLHLGGSEGRSCDG